MKDDYSRPYRLYFAYALNMNRTEIASICTNPDVIATARLPGYRMEFFGHTAVWDGAKESCVEDPDADLWGVVYKLSFYDAYRLDTWKDVRMDGAGEYFHYPADVYDDQGKTYPVLLYKKNMLGEARLPGREYMNLIIQGAREAGLPDSYINELEAVKTCQAGYPVPKRGNYDRSMLLDMGNECDESTDLREDPEFQKEKRGGFIS